MCEEIRFITVVDNLTVDLTGFRTTSETNLWACLRELFYIKLIVVGRSTLIPQAGPLGLNKKEKASQIHGSISLCFLTVAVV